ncbi:MAG: hypothetical protein FWD04_08665 [Conexibacteraceae bacterium]|nr:hypothetical protein [Conexibacteraceae bacterium]
MSDLIDDMLVGDFDYVYDGDDVYADVDYHRHEPALTWTPAAGRGNGPQRPAFAGPVARRPGTVPAREPVCASSATTSSRPITSAARERA